MDDFSTVKVVYGQMHSPALGFEMLVLLLFVILPLAAVIGHSMGRRQRDKTLAQGREVDRVIGETTLGAILAILGLLLAFSFNGAIQQAETRKATLIDEAAALGTVFLRADYLPEPGRSELKSKIFAYAETRIVPDSAETHDHNTTIEFLETTLAAQAELWPALRAATADPVPAPIKTFVASAMNDAIDAHLYRVQTLSVPVSDVTQAMVLAAALASLFLLGNRSGLLGRALSWRTFMLSGFLFIVMVTIVDVQRGTSGLVQIDQSPLLITLLDMRLSLEN